MKIQFKLLDSSKNIQNKILQAIFPDVVSIMNNAVLTIKKNLPNIVLSGITSAPEYQSLVSGNLQYELGIPDPMNKIGGLLDIWMKNIEYNYIKPTLSNNKITSKFSAMMIRADFSDVLYTDYAIVQDYNRGYSLPWLEWLLLRGNSVIIPSYQVVFGPNSSSRTGLAIMKNIGSGYWKVPAEFAGTLDDNWITRSLESVSPKIQELVERAFS
jgi:hypothetical protein